MLYSNDNYSYLDIIYQGKNKLYGSYKIRSQYAKRATLAMLITLGIISTGGIILLFKPSPTPVPVSKKLETETIVDRIFLPKEEIKKSVEPSPPPSSTEKKHIQKMTDNPIISINENVKTEDLINPPTADNIIVGKINQIGENDSFMLDAHVNGNDLSGTGIGINEGTGYNPTGVAAIKEAHRTVDEMPVFKDDIQTYLSKNIRYPAAARENEIQGRVVLQFVVDEIGQVTDIKIAKDIGGGCGEEAKRVVARMPKWNPGKQNGKAVKVYYTLPVSFTLN